MRYPQTKLLKSSYSIYKYCSLVFAALQFITVLPVFARSNTGQLRIPFGKTSVIVYDLKTGLMNVYKNNTAVFSNVYAQVKVNSRLISSKDYKSRTYIKTAINNGFGRGEKYIVKLTGGDLPEMDLVFYTYANREYFLTETEIKGQNLKSNYMAPFCKT